MENQIIDYQQQARTCKPSEQVALFDLAPSHCAPERIDPLQLQMQSMAFYRMPVNTARLRKFNKPQNLVETRSRSVPQVNFASLHLRNHEKNP
ncbi:hypothetical protein [Dulcicalothrix desertica]|uniref:hypothetical protein n=1 Tax=Dulcicalothrix desertica TaxID=32056 RepID=UPI000F8E844F|nr:hypothetical protein [Dulcicalothrix desertica]